MTRHPEVAARRAASKGDGIQVGSCRLGNLTLRNRTSRFRLLPRPHPSRLAPLAPQDDGLGLEWSRRFPMNIHEYQAKAVLREFGVPVPRGIAAFSVEEAEKAAHQLGGPVWVVKAQIHAGGRGKAGGVKVVKSIQDVSREATRILGAT